MEFEKATTPFGWCIFCEDIRQEINGKQTYIGVFAGSDMNILGTLPATIGRLSIFVAYRQRLSDGLEPLALEIHMPGDDDDKPTARADLSLQEASAKAPPPPPDVDDPLLGIGMGFEFSPLQISQEGLIRVSAVKAGKRYKLGALRVVSKPPKEKEAAN